jgi:hypothetical protein
MMKSEFGMTVNIKIRLLVCYATHCQIGIGRRQACGIGVRVRIPRSWYTGGLGMTGGWMEGEDVLE